MNPRVVELEKRFDSFSTQEIRELIAAKVGNRSPGHQQYVLKCIRKAETTSGSSTRAGEEDQEKKFFDSLHLPARRAGHNWTKSWRSRDGRLSLQADYRPVVSAVDPSGDHPVADPNDQAPKYHQYRIALNILGGIYVDDRPLDVIAPPFNFAQESPTAQPHEMQLALEDARDVADMISLLGQSERAFTFDRIGPWNTRPIAVAVNCVGDKSCSIRVSNLAATPGAASAGPQRSPATEVATASVTAAAFPLNPRFEMLVDGEEQFIAQIRDGVLEIYDLSQTLPAMAGRLAAGMFAEPGKYETDLRFANADGAINPEGRMDFAFNSAPTFPFNDVRVFGDVFTVVADGPVKAARDRAPA